MVGSVKKKLDCGSQHIPLVITTVKTTMSGYFSTAWRNQLLNCYNKGIKGWEEHLHLLN